MDFVQSCSENFIKSLLTSNNTWSNHITKLHNQTHGVLIDIDSHDKHFKVTQQYNSTKHTLEMQNTTHIDLLLYILVIKNSNVKD